MKIKLKTLAFAIMTILAVNANAKDDAPAVEGEFLIQFTPNATEADKVRVLKKLDAQQVERVKAKKDNGNGQKEGELSLIRHHQPDLNRETVKNKLEADPAVEFVEPNYIYTHQAVSNDAKYTNGSLWGMYGSTTSPNNQFGSGAGDAWASTTVDKTDCSSVYVGIIDEGYMYNHEDLKANAGLNPGEIGLDANGKDKSTNNVDDDGNLLADDVYGWDFNSNNKTVFDGVNDDHGTHVAGTIGAVGGNGKGVAGICWSVKLLNAKFLGTTGGTTANAVKAVDYFTNLKTRIFNPVNIVATNNSWGGGGESLSLKAAIERANAANILFVAAAGNATNDNDAIASYPASYDNANVIAVAALTSTGDLASYSNYGLTSVDLAAPGSAIWSTVPVSQKGKIVSGYASYSGTSMATPHVTGAAALFASQYKLLNNAYPSAAQIKETILKNAIATDSVAVKTATGARLNVSTF